MRKLQAEVVAFFLSTVDFVVKVAVLVLVTPTYFGAKWMLWSSGRVIALTNRKGLILPDVVQRKLREMDDQDDALVLAEDIEWSVDVGLRERAVRLGETWECESCEAPATHGEKGCLATVCSEHTLLLDDPEEAPVLPDKE